MNVQFLAVSETHPVLRDPGLAGRMEPLSIYPLTAVASDQKYTILSGGNLSCLFSSQTFGSIDFQILQAKLPPGSGIQAYSHNLPEGLKRRFLALSSKVPYERPFAPMQGLVSNLRRMALLRELQRLHESTSETFGTLTSALEGEKGVELLGSSAPILRALGPLEVTDSELDAGDEFLWNLSYLSLGTSRLAILFELSCLPSSSTSPMPMPQGPESLFVTCVEKPKGRPLSRLEEEIEGMGRFLGYFGKKEAGRKQETLTSFVGDGKEGLLLLKHFVLVFGETLVDLKGEGEKYHDLLQKGGYSFHASMIRTKENYAGLYPGNFPKAGEGFCVKSMNLGHLVSLFHP